MACKCDSGRSVMFRWMWVPARGLIDQSKPRSCVSKNASIAADRLSPCSGLARTNSSPSSRRLPSMSARHPLRRRWLRASYDQEHSSASISMPVRRSSMMGARSPPSGRVAVSIRVPLLCAIRIWLVRITPQHVVDDDGVVALSKNLTVLGNTADRLAVNVNNEVFVVIADGGRRLDKEASSRNPALTLTSKQLPQLHPRS